MPENHTSFFGDDSVKSVTLGKWMEWASNASTSGRRVVLPMIQRGSVWAPHKLLDLWDTLLRGMPVGALMASDVTGKSVTEELVTVFGEDGSQEATAGDISLIDGQQRTLAMLAGWPQGLQNPSRPVAIWVDLVDAPQGEYRFRLWATTKSQPFGYARINIGGKALGKLERKKLRLANQVFPLPQEKNGVQVLWKDPAFMPWESKFALPLTELINHRGALHEFVETRLDEYREALKSKSEPTDDSDAAKAAADHFDRKLRALLATHDDQLAQRITQLEKALDTLFSYEFPVIHVREETFADDDQSSDVNTDPALAVLFKRVGTGGVGLSDADYVYSIIKHHSPKVHDMVEGLLQCKRIAAIYIPTTLVMSAVRLTMLSFKTDDSKGQKLTDSAKLDKASFARTVRNHPEFISEFEKNIQSEGIFVTSLTQVLENISYTTDFTAGLPKHALRLVQIPLLETILAWHTLHKPSLETLKKSRLAMVRFLLQGNLCVRDYAKASQVAIGALREEDKIAASETFPDQVLLNLLAADDKALAHPLPSPETLSAVDGLTISSVETNGLRGWVRFAAEDEDNKKHAEVYRRWWNRTGWHAHPMLLWLQRDYVFPTFEKEGALAGMDDETPFDFDHILPSAQWANWTGIVAGNRLLDFPLKDMHGKIMNDDYPHGCIGNSIGNIHVLDSSTNRELGDASVSEKLKLNEFAKNALMDDEKQIAYWNAASASKEDAENPRHWDKDRALSFQKAVEHRTFDMYRKFYDDLQQE